MRIESIYEKTHGGVYISLGNRMDLGIADTHGGPRLVLAQQGEFIDISEPSMRMLDSIQYAIKKLKVHHVG